MIDYKKTCKWELGRYYEKLMAIDSLQDEIDMLTARMEGIRSPKMDATPVHGGSSTAEERIINAICTLETSVVNRVTSDEVENRSIFENEKSCTL